MKKTVLFAAICATTIGVALGQSPLPPVSGPPKQQPTSQSLAFTDNVSGMWMPGTNITLTVTLTYAGYSSFGLSYWLEVPTALAPFLAVGTGNAGDVTYSSQFPDPNQTVPNPAPFNSTSGADPGFMLETRDLGATNASTPGSEIAPGTYQINTVLLALAANAPAGTYTLHSTSINPRISEVTDTNFNDNNIIPPGTFIFTVVPEPSTFALLGLAAAGSGLVAYRRRKATR